jgi:hypothetical protein
MILPQYSLRKLLASMVGFALFCLVVSWGVRGSSWAFGVAIAGLSIVVALLVQALGFWLVWLFATVTAKYLGKRAASAGQQSANNAIVAAQINGEGA